MEIKGKVLSVEKVETITAKNGPLRKQLVIIESDSKFPKKVAVLLKNDKIDKYKLVAGDTVTVEVDAESREYNGRWYTDLNAWSVKTGNSKFETAEAPMFGSNDDGQGLPF